MRVRWSLALVLPTLGCGRLAFEAVLEGEGSPGADGATGDARMPDDSGAAADTSMQTSITRGQVLSAPSAQALSTSTAISFTPGTVVVAVPYWNDASRTVTIADSASHAWTPAPRQSVPTGCFNNVGTNIQIFAAAITASGTHTITVTQSGGTGWVALFVIEYDGVAGTALIDSATGMTPSVASNQMSAGTLTTSGAGVIVAGFHDSVGMGTMIAGPNLTARSVDTAAYGLLADAIVPAGSYPVTASLPAGVSDACWVAAAIALRAR